MSEQQYAPDVVADHRYYRPTRRGVEAEYASRWERVRPLLAGDRRCGGTGRIARRPVRMSQVVGRSREEAVMAYALVSLVVLVLGLAVVVASLRRQVRALRCTALTGWGGRVSADRASSRPAGRAAVRPSSVDPAARRRQSMSSRPRSPTSAPPRFARGRPGSRSRSADQARRAVLRPPPGVERGHPDARRPDRRSRGAETATQAAPRQPESTPTVGKGHGWIS